jgi:O-glycosyl hydrolase
MVQRGRKSAAALVAAPLEIAQRPDAPYDLTDEQSDEWWAIVNRMPSDWFPRETHGMLAQYCRHVVRARRLAQLIDKAEGSEEFDLKEYRELLISEEAQTRAMASLATRMRLSQQTTYDKSKKKPAQGKNLWERGPRFSEG